MRGKCPLTGASGSRTGRAEGRAGPSLDTALRNSSASPDSAGMWDPEEPGTAEQVRPRAGEGGSAPGRAGARGHGWACKRLTLRVGTGSVLLKESGIRGGGGCVRSFAAVNFGGRVMWCVPSGKARALWKGPCPLGRTVPSGKAVPSWKDCALWEGLCSLGRSVPSGKVCALWEGLCPLGRTVPSGKDVPSWKDCALREACALWEGLCSLGRSVPSGKVCALWEGLCPLGRTVSSGKVCALWEGLCPLGRCVPSGALAGLAPDAARGPAAHRSLPSLPVSVGTGRVCCWCSSWKDGEAAVTRNAEFFRCHF
ncbi:uncharacterized protein LOC127464307 isoform X1 [Manacus candei]|uniref:uncharacterized protein LOC127464307 isoform X1 n=1 Tax=Manacus candei TaxID=415023 RepID=UPI0022270A99|nr:uncharacterized protein LOC127464307 isoform X1 [Manacus candei]